MLFAYVFLFVMQTYVYERKLNEQFLCPKYVIVISVVLKEKRGSDEAIG